MNDKLPTIAGVLLGLTFVAFGLNHFISFLPSPPSPPEGSPPAMFFGALFTTGYLSFIKAIEIVGGILVAIPKTRNFGLLALGPVIVNILAFQVFMTGGAGLTQPPVLLVTLLSAYILFSARGKFAKLIN